MSSFYLKKVVFIVSVSLTAFGADPFMSDPEMRQIRDSLSDEGI